MQAGVIGVVSGNFNSLESYIDTYHQDGTALTSSLQVSQTLSIQSGEPVYHGEAAMEVIEDRDSVDIDEETGEISTTTSGERTGKHTEFIVISDSLMVVKSGGGHFAFDLLTKAIPGVEAQPAILDLNSYAEDYYQADEVDPWQVGFYGNAGQAEKGVVYGEDVFSDSEMGEVLDRSQVNQLGLEYPIGDDLYKITTSRSGYAEVYAPPEMDTDTFAQFVVDELERYVEMPD